MVHPPSQDDEQVPQVEAHDQGGAQDVQVEEEEAPQAPPTQVRATIQRNHPVDQILGDISKGVTTRSRLVNFCEHYSFVSSIEPFRVEETLLDPDWVLAMQEVGMKTVSEFFGIPETVSDFFRSESSVSVFLGIGIGHRNFRSESVSKSVQSFTDRFLRLPFWVGIYRI